jgi:hypothetical protein
MSLWSCVAVAVNSLTITVSKVWTSNIATYSGKRASCLSSLQPQIPYSTSGMQGHRRARSHALCVP